MRIKERNQGSCSIRLVLAKKDEKDRTYPCESCRASFGVAADGTSEPGVVPVGRSRHRSQLAGLHNVHRGFVVVVDAVVDVDFYLRGVQRGCLTPEERR